MSRIRMPPQIALAVSLSAVLSAAMASPALAQAPGTIAGRVTDLAGQPLEWVLVFVDDGERFVRTDANGAFRLDGIVEGQHVLSLRHGGSAPRSFNLPVTAGVERNVGTVQLQPGPVPRATLSGVVVDQDAGTPLAGATIALNGVLVAQTDSLGGFAVSDATVAWGPNEVTVVHRSLTETSTTDRFWISSPDETVELAVMLEVTPIALPALTATTNAPARSRRLETRGFYDRMEESSNGIFWTAAEIDERDPDDWDDLLRGVQFSRTRSATTFGRAQTGQCGRDAEPIAFLDGAYVGNLDVLVTSVRMDAIEGIEIYRSIADIPIDFNIMGAECGVVAVWTRGSL